MDQKERRRQRGASKWLSLEWGKRDREMEWMWGSFACQSSHQEACCMQHVISANFPELTVSIKLYAISCTTTQNTGTVSLMLLIWQTEGSNWDPSNGFWYGKCVWASSCVNVKMHFPDINVMTERVPSLWLPGRNNLVDLSEVDPVEAEQHRNRIRHLLEPVAYSCLPRVYPRELLIFGRCCTFRSLH